MSTEPQPDAKPDFPMDAKPWLAMLSEAEKRDKPYHDRCDAIDRAFACLSALADGDTLHDRELQVYWANLQVLAPTIYSRQAVPVVSERFRDRRDLVRKAADLVQRALIGDPTADDDHEEIKHVRDDLARLARGAIRVVVVDEGDGPRLPAEHISRRDFRHGPGRKWREVPFCAVAGYYTRDEYKERFGKPAPEGVEFKSRAEKADAKEDEDSEVTERKCRVWEIWHKPKRKVVWVAEGAKELSDARDPIHKLDGFWPFPRPAFGTLKPETLTPIPDYVYYQDQLEEINELTDRIAKLTEMLRLKGFYAAGSGDIGKAIEIAMADMDNRGVMIPVSSTAALGGPSLKDAIVWMPVETVAITLRELIEQRRQLMQDVYEITGLSDIMRGATEAQETLGAQQLKAQFGSVRVRERQAEMQRIARDVFRIKAEIMAEEFPEQALLEMSQVEDLPTQAELAQQAAPLQAQLQQIMQQAQQAMMQDPAQAEQMQAQAQEAAQPIQAQLQELSQTVTLDAVMELLRSQRLRPFALEVESDSTIEPDQMAEKQNRTEFMQALGPMLQQGAMALQTVPDFAEFIAESVRFVASGFKVPRSMDDAIDALAEKLANYQPPQPQGEDPAAAQAAAAAEQAKAQAAQTKAEADAQAATVKAQAVEQESAAKVQAAQQEAAIEADNARLTMQSQMQEMAQRQQAHDQAMEKISAEIERINAQAKAASKPKPETRP